MPTPAPESSDDELLARWQPKALLARGLEDTGEPPVSATPPSVPQGGEDGPILAAATLAETFPEFHFEGVISRGGFGTVYRAEHRRMKRRVAVKILSSAVTRNVSAVARFEREIAAIGTLDHPGIVRAFDAGQRGGVWFLSMELVEGADLSTLSRTLGPLPPAEACEMIRQAALAIQHAHEHQLIHRDVKPGNLMLTTGPDGEARVKVLDFGLAQLAHNDNTGGELTISGELLGTVDYIAPEQITNPRTVDARADVYGLGATLFRLLSGQTPHQATDATTSLYAKIIRIAHEPCPGIATLRPDIAPSLTALVDRMVALHPAERFATAGEVAGALAPFAEASQLPALLARVPRLELQESLEHLEPLPSPSSRRQLKRRAMAPLSLAALAVVGSVVFLIARKSTPLEDANANANLLAHGVLDTGQDPGAWLQAYLQASQPQEGDQFGHSVAVSGDTVVVGVPGDDSSTTGADSAPDENAANSGAAYVFVRSGSTWTQQACLKASNPGANDQFGCSVAISGDTVIVGAMQEASSTKGVNSAPNESAAHSGAAYVFVRSGSTWSQQAWLKASNTGANNEFGCSVAVSGDTLVVGAWRENSSTTGVNSEPDENASVSGAAYVFTRSGTTWMQQAYLKASNAEAGDTFGWSVAVAGDTVVVGANLEDSNATGVDGDQADNSASYSGAAYVFVRSGSTWSQQAYLKASHTSTVIHDQFGHSVAVSGDTVVVGAMNEDNYAKGVNGDQANQQGDGNYGAAYVFVRSGSTWSQQAYLKSSNPDERDQFGYSVAVSGDTVVVGAVNEASNATGVDGDQSDNSVFKAGAAYLFERRGSTWSQRAYLKATNTGKYDRFGRLVAVSGDTVVVGVSREPGSNAGAISTPGENASLSGAAYIFKMEDPADGER